MAHTLYGLFCSLFISALLEGVILLSQHVISTPIRTLEQISSSFSISEQERKKLTYVIQVVASMMIALSLFLIYGAVQKVVYTGVDIGAAVVSTMITELIPTVVTTIEWKSADTGWRKVAKDVLSEVRSTAALSMPAIGISLGNAAGHLFHLSPFLFLA